MTEREPASDAPDLDRSFLTELSEGDRQFEAEILSLFIDSAMESSLALKAARNSDGWQGHAHKLHGAARAIGALKLADLAQRAQQIPAGDNAKRERSLAEIEAAIAALEKECRG